MSSATVQLLRTLATAPYAVKYINQAATIYRPRDPLVSAMHLTEHLDVSPLTGTIQPGAVVTFELPYEVDIIKGVNLYVRMDRIVNSTGVATNKWPVDYFGLSLISEVLFRFGTERVQRIAPAEMFEKIHSAYNDEGRNLARSLVGGGITTGMRNTRCLAGTQQFVVPLWTLLGLHLGADPSQAFAVRCLSERCKIQITFAPGNQLFASDGNFYFVNAGAGTAAAPPANNAGWFVESSLRVEGVHVADDERRALERVYEAPRRYFFREAQYATSIRVPATTVLGTGAGTVDISLREFNQPIVKLSIFLRWAADLDRTTNDGTLTVSGAAPWRCTGWYAPGAWGTTISNTITNVSLPIISHVEIRVGANAYLLKKTRVEDLLDYERLRCLNGSGVVASSIEATTSIPGINAAPAILNICFSDAPARENAQLGFVDVRLRVLEGRAETHTLSAAKPDGQPGAAPVLQHGVRRWCDDDRRGLDGGHQDRGPWLWRHLGAGRHGDGGHVQPAELCQEQRGPPVQLNGCCATLPDDFQSAARWSLRCYPGRPAVALRQLPPLRALPHDATR